MEIIIFNPGDCISSQSNLQSYPSIYKSVGTRVSKIDNKTTVLDVRLPILSYSQKGLVVLEGHTRFCESAKRSIAIESCLIFGEEDLFNCPKECFFSLSFRECLDIYHNLDYYQRESEDKGYAFIKDLLKTI